MTQRKENGILHRESEKNFSVMDADTPDNVGIIASQDLGLLSADRISVH